MNKTSKSNLELREYDETIEKPTMIETGGRTSSHSIARNVTSKIREFFNLITLSDERGTPSQISALLFLLLLMGTLLAMLVHLLSNDDDNHTDGTAADHKRFAWVQPVSSSLGYTYFLSWSVSFYPQVILNHKRKKTSGLSIDFCILNVLGYICYSIYNVGFFWSHTIQQLYIERHDNKNDGDESETSIMVQGNDVAFAIHAFLLSSYTLGQIYYYYYQQHPKQSLEVEATPLKSAMITQESQTNQKLESYVIPMKSTLYFLVTVVIGATTYAITIILYPRDGEEEGSSLDSSDLEKYLNWLDFCYVLSSIKILITILKYVPQVILNYQRKSTVGWTIWMVVLDLYGGVLSVAQLLLDCWNSHDWGGISGNIAKFLLGFVSIIFDLIFIFQHYVLYRNNGGRAEEQMKSNDITEREGRALCENHA